MPTCFVIQPFDKGKFDKRFDDTFRPAIVKAGLEPYRVDLDPAVRIPIDEIEKGIASSAICLAEITLDNPNVWYELGYAFACGKDVVMVSSEERTGGFPFDIGHRQIIKYQTGSASDFKRLEEAIFKKITALLEKTKTVVKLSDTPVMDTEGLKSHEIALLILIMENQLSAEDHSSLYTLKGEMEKAGYTSIAASVGLRRLARLGMIGTFTESDYNNNTYSACRITEKGEDWILANEEQLVFRKSGQKADKANPKNFIGFDSDELPF